MGYSFHPEAQQEFLAAVDFYEAHEKGLGHDFALEVYAAIERVLAYPRLWPWVAGEIRRCLVRRFPYGVLYGEDGDSGEILIVAVMNLHRKPGYWKSRKQDKENP